MSHNFSGSIVEETLSPLLPIPPLLTIRRNDLQPQRSVLALSQHRGFMRQRFDA